MPAPKGNQYALGNNGGAPTKYKPEYCDAIIDYFRREPVVTNYKKEYYKDGSLKSETPVLCPADFPTLQEFADSLNVTYQTLLNWSEEYKEFFEAITRARQIQESIWLKNGMSNLYNAQFAQFFGKNCLGYKDKVEVDANVDATITVTLAGDLDKWAK